MKAKINGESGLRRVFSVYKTLAYKEGKVFLITLEEFRIISSSNCFYCNSPPSNFMKMLRYDSSYTYSGMDRLNSLRGYTLDNVVPCCTECNMMKWVFSKEDFLKRIEKIYNHQNNHKDNSSLCSQ